LRFQLPRRPDRSASKKKRPHRASGEGGNSAGFVLVPLLSVASQSDDLGTRWICITDVQGGGPGSGRHCCKGDADRAAASCGNAVRATAVARYREIQVVRSLDAGSEGQGRRSNVLDGHRLHQARGPHMMISVDQLQR